MQSTSQHSTSWVRGFVRASLRLILLDDQCFSHRVRWCQQKEHHCKPHDSPGSNHCRLCRALDFEGTRRLEAFLPHKCSACGTHFHHTFVYLIFHQITWCQRLSLISNHRPLQLCVRISSLACLTREGIQSCEDYQDHCQSEWQKSHGWYFWQLWGT